MPGRAGPALCRRPGMIQGRKDGTVRTWNSGSRGAYCSTGTRAHCSTLSQFEKQGRKPGSFVVQAEAGADRYVAMGMPRQ